VRGGKAFAIERICSMREMSVYPPVEKNLTSTPPLLKSRERVPLGRRNPERGGRRHSLPQHHLLRSSILRERMKEKGRELSLHRGRGRKLQSKKEKICAKILKNSRLYWGGGGRSERKEVFEKKRRRGESDPCHDGPQREESY